MGKSRAAPKRLGPEFTKCSSLSAMPDDLASARTGGLDVFDPHALRTSPDQRRHLEALTERVFALHPAWPWPLIEEEARRVEETLAKRGTDDDSIGV